MSNQWRVLALAVAWLSVGLIPLHGPPVLLPAIADEFHTTTAATAWVVLIYSLSMAGAFMPGSHAGDLLGHRRVALIGSTFDAFALLAIALVPSLGWLIAVRFFQGIAHSLGVPNFQALAIGSFPKEQRGRAAGVTNGFIGASMLAIPPFVGFVSDTFGWRWVFVIAAGLVFGIGLWISFTLEEQPPPHSKPALREFDLTGAALLMSAVAPLIIGVQMLRRSDDLWAWLLIASASLLICAFIAFEARLSHPTLPVRMFRQGEFSALNLQNLALQFCHGAGVYLLPVFLIRGLDWTATYAGTVIVAYGLARPLAAPCAGFLADRLGSQIVVLTSAALQVGSFLGLARFGTEGDLLGLVPFLLISGAAHSMGNTALQKQMYATVPADQLGIAPGVMGLGRHLAQAIGVGVAATIFAGAFGELGGAAEGPGVAFRSAALATASIGAAIYATGWLVLGGHALRRKRR